MTIYYEPSDFNELTVLLRWRGTIMPSVLFRPVIWFLMAFHVSMLYLHIQMPDVIMPELPWKLTGTPTSLLVFFLVFYSGNCYTRYYAFYSKCTGMGGCVMAWVGLLRVHFPKASVKQLWNLSRHVVASVYVLYFQLAGGSSDGGKLVTDTEWAVLLKTQLLSESEVAKLKSYRGFKPFLCQVWALRAVSDHLASDSSKAAGAALGPFQAQALALRGNCADIVNTMTQPIPFPYFHTLTLMLSLNLVLIAYSMIGFGTVMSIPVFFIICLVLLGLKETAVALSDPFGGDDVDFNIDIFMAAMLANTKAMIAPSADYVSDTLEPPSMKVNSAFAA
eukprot:CAMPEP_0181193606 /NCGR_PEP_ID=MMETSP1096-20121128/13907_1 /TAXON_ID=156174 ORGANISM="Chrysochromulina ericina, Strain CCMP281" /NCGR_SAMPLE_ID=MMETSP1096 /ASSEMBLY_ACC=CAM_ASM_000453 /LENGTH=333 /DNA_ID=CAMNT_0023283081 /DNA_START=57 /DNA_END=1058 /DNA_ORIENTATION=-